MADRDATERILLTLPAHAPYVRVARITTAGIASRLGFDVDEIEQLKLAVGELWALLVGSDGETAPTMGTVTLTFAVEPRSLVVDVDVSLVDRVSDDLVSRDLAEKLLGEVVDEHRVGVDGRTASVRKLVRAPR